MSAPALAPDPPATVAVSVTLALAFPGDPFDPGTWSGTPAGLARGLSQLGAEVVPLRADLPGRLEQLTRNAIAATCLPRAGGHSLRDRARRARLLARNTPSTAAAHTLAARARARSAGPLDAVIQIGAGFSLPPGTPFVTFEDLTIVQALEAGYPEWRRLPRRAVARRIELQRRVYRAARACCATTSWAAESIVRDYGISAAKVHVVGVGRNHEPLPAERDWCTPRFLFVGRDWEGKNGDAVLRAFALLREQHPAARLDLVGRHPEISQPGVTGHGFLRLDDRHERARVESLYEQATCFVMPSHYEASALAYVEAAAAGLPVIGTSVGGSADLIGDGGRLVHPQDDGALLAAMRELSRPETAAAVGELAQRRSELFTWRAVAARVLHAAGLA